VAAGTTQAEILQEPFGKPGGACLLLQKDI